MNIKLVVGSGEGGGIITPGRLDLLADGATTEDLNYFSDLVSNVLKTDPMYSFPTERGKPIRGFEVKNGTAIKTTESPVLMVDFYRQDISKSEGGSRLYFATSEGLTHLRGYAFVVSDGFMATKQGKQLFEQPNYLVFTAEPSDGAKVLEAIAQEHKISVPFGAIHHASATNVYTALGFNPLRGSSLVNPSHQAQGR